MRGIERHCSSSSSSSGRTGSRLEAWGLRQREKRYPNCRVSEAPSDHGSAQPSEAMEPGLDERSERICRLITEPKESVMSTCVLVSRGAAYRSRCRKVSPSVMISQPLRAISCRHFPNSTSLKVWLLDANSVMSLLSISHLPAERYLV